MKMENVNEIMNLVSVLAASNSQTKDTLAELAEQAPSKDELIKDSKKATNTKWMAIDAALAIGNMVLNKYRQKQFENIQETAEADAEAQMKEREERIQNLKSNLGITTLEERIQKQDEVLENISKMLSHLVAEQKKEKKEKQVKDLIPTKFKKKEDEDNEWV